VTQNLNWFGLAAGAATIFLVAISTFMPWWQFQVGNPTLLEAKLSPLNTTFSGMGDAFTIPLILALNITAILTLAASGTIMIIYSIFPTKPYSLKLLNFSYRKPLYSIIFFILSIVTISIIAQSIVGLNIPLMGKENVQFSQNLYQGATVNILVSADLLWPFWLSIAVSGLCIAARLYHKKIVPIQQPK